MSDFLQKPTVKIFIQAATATALGYLAYYFIKSRESPRGIFRKHPRSHRKFKLIKRIVLSPDTRLFRFEIPENEELGISVGKHVKAHAIVAGKEISRNYTPVSTVDERGYFDLVIKVYFPNDEFPSGGLMSQQMDSLNIGDEMEFSAPYGTIEYLSELDQFNVSVGRTLSGLKNIGLLAVGTGITPMWQLIQEIFKNERNTTKITLLYGNRYEHDILLRDRLEKLAKSNPTRFKVIFTLSKPDFTWDKEKGRIGKEMIEKYFPTKKFDACFLCGTLRMMDDAKTHLTSIGHNPSNVFKY